MTNAPLELDIETQRQWLDGIARTFQQSETVAPGLMELAAGLSVVRERSSPSEWRDYVQSFRAHPVLNTLLEDPYTARGFRRPRGYPGDAVLIDFMYGAGEGERLVAKATPLGRLLHDAAMTVSAVTATRGRRDHLADCIDQVCQERLQPHILSVACGHLREAAISTQFAAGRVGRFVALDQDRRSLRIIERAHPGIECRAESVAQLVDSPQTSETFDLVYASGLYDYLDDDFGSRLINAMAQLLRPGGKVLVANFVPGLTVSGYMEAAMDWWLIYRDPQQVLSLADQLPAGFTSRVYRDSHHHLAYLEVRREY